MKKFFGKKPVMITFVALAVVMLVVYIGMLARPVAVGFSYSEKEDGITTTYKFGLKKVEGTMSDGKNKTTMDTYYYCQDNIVVFDYFGVVQNDKDYKEWKKDVRENWDTYKEMGMEINAFKMGDKDEATCAGSIVFAVVGGIVELVLLAGAGLAVFYAVKKK